MNEGFIVLGYLHDKGNWTAKNISGRKLTHINYSFANIRDGIVCGGEPDKLEEVKKLKDLFPHLKILISIGGWAAEGFSDAALTEESRFLFSQTAVEYMKRYGFEGIDLDWEYPSSQEGGIKARPEDVGNYNLLLAELRRQLDIEGPKDGTRYLLTAATGALPYQADFFDLKTISGIVDFINIMTYDLYNGFSAKTGHHTGLYGSDIDKEVPSSKESVEIYLGRGIPEKKLVLGCAFYGRGWDVADTSTNGLNVPAASECRSYSYSKLVSDYINKNGYKRFWDDYCKAPYLWNGKHFIGYDDPESLRHKADFIKAKGLAGAMFWEYSHDHDGELLEILYSELSPGNCAEVSGQK